MTKTYRAVLIDPHTRTITETLTPGDITSMYIAIGCDCVDRVSLTSHDDCWIDDNGFLSDGTPVVLIRTDSGPARLAGRVLIVGRKGPNVADAEVSLSDIIARVQWTDMLSTGEFTEPYWERNTLHMGIPIVRPAIHTEGTA